MSPDSAAQASATLRELDRDRYFATLVLPAQARPAVTALYAFGAEIAAIRERVREPMPGEIRLQWWKDALTGQGHGEVRQNPLADALLSTVAEYQLPPPPLVRLIDARRFDLYQDPMPDMASFEGYAGETVSVLYQLAAMILNGGSPVETGDAAGHLGVAQALIGHLRAFGYNAAHGRIFLPWCRSLPPMACARPTCWPAAPATALLPLAGSSASWPGGICTAGTAIAALPRPLRPAFVSAALLAPALSSIEANADAPFALPPDLADWQKLVRLTWRSWRG